MGQISQTSTLRCDSRITLYTHTTNGPCTWCRISQMIEKAPQHYTLKLLTSVHADLRETVIVSLPILEIATLFLQSVLDVWESGRGINIPGKSDDRFALLNCVPIEGSAGSLKWAHLRLHAGWRCLCCETALLPPCVKGALVFTDGSEKWASHTHAHKRIQHKLISGRIVAVLMNFLTSLWVFERQGTFGLLQQLF